MTGGLGGLLPIRQPGIEHAADHAKGGRLGVEQLSKRTTRALRACLWISALVLCCFSAAMLVEANKPKTGNQRLIDDPIVTGSIVGMRWCGAASWYR